MFEAGLDYLNRMKPALWDASTVITLYRNEKPTLLPGELISRIIKDLEELGQRRPTMKKPIEKLLSTLKCVHALDQAFTPAEDHSETVNKSKSDEVAPTSKVADIWNSHGNVTINQSNSRHKRKENDDASNVPLDVKKGKKSFSFVPQLKPSTSTHKSRVSEEDRITLAPLYHIKINDDHTAYTPTNIIHDYEQNIDDQAVNASLSKRPLAYNFLKQALNEPLANLRQFLWTHGQDDHDGIEGSKEQASDKEEQLMELIRLVLTDYSTICLKPQYPAPTNERTPFVESIIPLFKYMSSITKSIAFVWCEKGLAIPKAAKLMDGIGTAVLDNVERVLLESSGDADDMHTNEDTLKLLEYTSLCLQTEKSRYQQASHDTFVQRRLFGIQFVGYKLTLLSTFISQDDRWACLWERSAIIPHRWEERKFWLQAFELIVKLMDLIAEQDRITQQLIDEHTGSAIVLKGNTLRSYYSRHAFAPPPRSEDLIQALPL